jgi:hypothetical protein
MTYLKKTIFLLLSTVATSLCAQALKVDGTIKHTLNIPQAQTKQRFSARAALAIQPLSVRFLKIKLSDNAKAILQKRIIKANTPIIKALTSTKLPAKIDLGMNGVPVLNQGQYGTCVTFATSAAIDATLNKGDQISQLCQLQLGNYLAEQGYIPSGWDGSFAPTALSLFAEFGYINKNSQRANTCGGLYEYPTDGEIPQGQLSVEQFHMMSNDLSEEIAWSPIIDVYTALVDRTDTSKTLNEVKSQLAKGRRISVGVLLFKLDLGVAGAVGRYHQAYDSWVATPEIREDASQFIDPAGHEMVIIGYDDNAIAIDEDGRQHKGLLKLRNSWSDKVGDKGDFYMSYDYFKFAVIEAYSFMRA